jgi:hypothetical protein
MKIGIDISQLAFEKTGVANYLQNLVQNLIKEDKKNDYVLFYSSMRKKLPLSFSSNRVKVKSFKFPPTFLDIIWNKLHIIPIENFIGDVDVFITSDWTEPPTKKAKKATILYDLIVYKYPHETDAKIVEVQKRKLNWVKKESDKIICISQSTAKDAQQILGIDKGKLSVLYPGFSL